MEIRHIHISPQMARRMSGYWVSTNAINTTAPANAISPTIVKGSLSIDSFRGYSPVSTPEGMNACANIILNANIMTNGKNIHIRVTI